MFVLLLYTQYHLEIKQGNLPIHLLALLLQFCLQLQGSFSGLQHEWQHKHVCPANKYKQCLYRMIKHLILSIHCPHYTHKLPLLYLRSRVLMTTLIWQYNETTIVPLFKFFSITQTQTFFNIIFYCQTNLNIFLFYNKTYICFIREHSCYLLPFKLSRKKNKNYFSYQKNC